MCMRGRGRDATEGGLNTHFCERLPWCGVDPHPWPSPPWIWQGLSRLIFHPARESGRRTSSHRGADKSNPTQFIEENIFSHRLHLSLMACVTLSHLWPLFLFPLCIWERSFPNQSESQDGRAAAVHIRGFSHFQASQGPNDKALW